MISTLTVEEWTAFDAAHPAPTFFARPAWTLALCDATPQLTPSPLRVGVRGRSFLLPAVRSKARLGMRDLLAFPMGAYTCVLDEAGSPANPRESEAVLEAVGRVTDRARVIYWPLVDQPHLSGANTTQFETAVIDCAGGFDSAIAGIRGVTRRMAGQAERRGVVLRKAENTKKSIDAYYEILLEASKGWGLERPPISASLLQAVMDRGGNDIGIWFAEVAEEPIAGGIVLFGSDELFFWSAAMRRSHSQYRPSNALNIRLIREACDRGVRWYNLGASEGLAGVERFKSDLGATSKLYASFTMRSSKFHMYERVRKLVRTAEVT